LIFSWTTVASIWLSGFGGMETTFASIFHCFFSTNAANSDPGRRFNAEGHLEATRTAQIQVRSQSVG
jgi:predicted benzoate:H+ symporter BenE